MGRARHSRRAALLVPVGLERLAVGADSSLLVMLTMTDPVVLLEVTHKGAIYVNNTRITDRGSKWGVHTIVFSASVPQSKVVSTLRENGFDVSRIDTEPYRTELLWVG